MQALPTVLSDGVISLAPFELADAATLMQWDADPEVQRWFDWPVTPPVDDAATYAARRASAEETIRQKWRSWESGEEFAFIIHAAESGEGIGWIDVQPRGCRRGSIAYAVLDRHRCRGAATRSVALVSRYAFDVLNWVRLEIRTNADNVASRAVAAKAGFRLEGLLRSYCAVENYQPLLGQRFDWVIYGRLRTDH
jgi:RimJ/RimL family protein N-acetyltransferase